ncbi:MAG TPA: type II toxin-antitoxin system VapC family toxin [Thermomicrobiales bacterium]|jgi:tRNA(fMet)-specific endonuclease VapC
MYLVDTDWIADYLGGKQSAVDLLESLKDDGLAISLVTFGEIYDGVYHGRDPIAAERNFAALLGRIVVIDLNQAIMKRFAHIRGGLRATGRVIGDTDILIAATAIEHGLSLVTRNRRHYDRIPGLTLYELPTTPPASP